MSKNHNFVLNVALVGIAIAFPSIALTTQSVKAVEFQDIADTSTPVPQGQGNFSSLSGSDSGSWPVISNGNVAFLGDPDSNHSGIYADFGNGLQVVANTTTTVPGSSQKFGGFLRPSISGTNIAFEGGAGIYANIGGNLTTIACEVAAPNCPAGPTFDYAAVPFINGTNVAFDGSFHGTGTDYGAYANFGNGVEVIADSTIQVPGTSSNFLNPGSPVISGTNTAFAGGYIQNGVYQSGIFQKTGNVIQTLATTNTLIPSSTNTFGEVNSPTFIKGNKVAFIGYQGTYDAGNVKPIGIYGDLGNGLETLADFNTLIYQKITPSKFLYLPDLTTSIDNLNVAFNLTLVGSPSSNPYSSHYGNGIFLDTNNQLHELIASGDTLDGKTVSSLGLGREGLSGNQAVFWASFTDGSEGIFLANNIFDSPVVSEIDFPLLAGVPEPSNFLGAAIAIGLGIVLKKKISKRQ